MGVTAMEKQGKRSLYSGKSLGREGVMGMGTERGSCRWGAEAERRCCCNGAGMTGCVWFVCSTHPAWAEPYKAE